jgi:N-acetylglutamate synthase-like GNAT family acetyltransferase
MRHMQVLRVSTLPHSIHGLAANAREEGHGHLDRLITEFNLGTNRFSQPGEALFIATREDRLIAIGGVNIDPYALSTRAGRIRRVYVHPQERRHGVATRLMQAIEAHAQGHFDALRLYTSSTKASDFYTSLGYDQITGLNKVSHAKRFAAAGSNITMKSLLASDNGLTLQSESDALDVLSSGLPACIFYPEDLHPDFFDLSNQIAGTVLQKFVNYNYRVAIVLDDDHGYGERVTELIRDHKSHPFVQFFASADEAAVWLS